MIGLRLRLRPDKEGKAWYADLSRRSHNEGGSSVERRRVRVRAQFRFDTPQRAVNLTEAFIFHSPLLFVKNEDPDEFHIGDKALILSRSP